MRAWLTKQLKNTATYVKQKGVPYVMSMGYIPCDSVREATSIAMEYAVDDWSIAQMAKKMGKEQDYNYFYQEEIKLRKELDYPPFTHIIKNCDFRRREGSS